MFAEEMEDCYFISNGVVKGPYPVSQQPLLEHRKSDMMKVDTVPFR